MEPFAYSSGCDPKTETLCTTRAFVEAWARGTGGRERPFHVQLRDGQQTRDLYAIETRHRFGFRTLHIGKFGLWASPGWVDALSRSTIQDVLRKLQRISAVSLSWKVRYDHSELAGHLEALGLARRELSTHVVDLNAGYQKVFAHYNETTRNMVRRIARDGKVRVRSTVSAEEIGRCHALYTQAMVRKGRSAPRPLVLLVEIANIPHAARFMIAEYAGKIIAGALFLRDGLALNYSHPAFDPEYTNVCGSTAVMDAGIRWGCSFGAMSFDMGGNNGVAHLRQFKESWGAKPRQSWRFEWVNPFWNSLRRFHDRLAAVCVSSLGSQKSPTDTGVMGA